MISQEKYLIISGV
uniref:Uncharacterized protein n=1 Tax=Arundo donax TaxID=35708 RepID=A0A0A8ZYM3_ARUDO